MRKNSRGVGTYLRLFTEGMSKLDGEFEAASVEATRAALKQFPTNSMIYTMLVAFAQRSDGDWQRELATDILNAPGAPPGAKALAGHLRISVNANRSKASRAGVDKAGEV